MDAIDSPVSSLRPLSVATGVLSRADGSARFSFAAGQAGACEVLASVTGPIEVRPRDEKLDAATVEVGVLPVRGLAGPSHRCPSLQKLRMQGRHQDRCNMRYRRSSRR